MFSQWKKIDIVIAILFLLTNISYLFFSDRVFSIFLWALIFTAGGRLLVLVKQRLLWKIRNRLFFSGLFFVAGPIFFVLFFCFFTINVLIAHYGITIIGNLMRDQLAQMEAAVETQLMLKDRAAMAQFAREAHNTNPEHVNVAIFHEGEGGFKSFYKYPDSFPDTKITIEDFKGYFLLNDKLYFGVIKKRGQYATLFSILVNQEFLNELSGISDFHITYRNPYSDKLKLSKEITDDPAFTEEEHIIFPYFYEYRFLDFNDTRDTRANERVGSFLLKIDYSKLYDKIRSAPPGSVQDSTRKFIYFLILLFGFFIVFSFFIGFRVIRVITRSINQITKGTQKIRNGDFSVRIKTRSKDQLQYLGESFNEMAAGIDRLLSEEKEKQRLEEELRIARSIQLKLLPANDFDSEEFEIAAVNIPAAEIAGDYFDYYHKAGEYLTLLVADVSGKGASAAFYMAELKGLINHLYKTDISPAELIAQCHDSLITSFDKITFITMIMAKFMTRQKKFILSRAGHTKALFFEAGKNECRELYPEGVAIGLTNFSQEKTEEIEVAYGPGDILFLFSDGLSEILNEDDEMMGVDRLKEIIRDNKGSSAREIKQKMLDFSIHFSGKKVNSDDLTFIVLKTKC